MSGSIRSALVLAVAGLLILSGCGGADPASRFDLRPLATIDDAVITVSQFQSSYVAFLIRTGLNDDERSRRVHLENLIDQKLLAAEAGRRGWEDDEPAQSARLMEQKKAVGGRFFEEAFVESLPAPTDAELRQAFARWKAQVVVRHLFFRREADARASYARLQGGTDFLEEAALVYGLAEIDSSAGFLGAVRYYQVDDAFAEAAFALQEGDVSEPVRSRFGWHIIRADGVQYAPLLTESDFQTRRPGLSSQFRLRRRRLEGDRFVRSFMEGLNVTVEPDAIRAMASLIDDATYEVRPQPTIVQRGEATSRLRPDSLRAMINPATPLLSYRYRGRTRTFTAGDYVAWLPELPFAEARSNAAASIGRALSNEVFYLEGLRRDLDDAEADVIIDEEFEHYLATRLRDSLRANPGEPTQEFIDRAIERLKLVVNPDSIRVEALAPAAAQYGLLSELREYARIHVDEALFAVLMRLGNP